MRVGAQGAALVIAGGAALFGFQSSHGAFAQAAKTTAPNQAKAQRSAPTGKGPAIEGDGSRSKAILAHLNSVLRFYHDTEAPIQKEGEPSDVVYRNQVVSQATQAAGFAFQSAEAEAALMEGSQPETQPGAQGGSQTQRLQQARNNIEQRIAALKAQEADLANKLNAAPARKRAALQQQRAQVEGELELQTAMSNALGKIASMSDISNGSGFAAQVGQLERSAPGIASNKAPVVAPTLESLTAVRSAGVTSQSHVLFELLSTRQSIDNLAKEADGLHRQELALRAPLIDLLKKTVAEGQALSQSPALASPAPASPAPAEPSSTGGSAQTAGKTQAASSTPSSTLSSFNELSKRFKAISDASVPLSQEILTLEQTQASLQTWRASVNDEYRSILRSILVRVFSIAVALAVIFGFGEVWRRATKRYVHDVRRRRQILIVRRLVIGFLVGLVLIFGLVTQFSSLATFAGFITAGLAVGLQTILLSVAAYFFIIGRYGIRVGDRITIAAVTGDVVEVGLVRFYVMELAGSGSDLYPTGRVAVFSNAVLFQAGTPLYKQMPGTHYAWHELTVKLAADADYRTAVQEFLKASQGVYDGYRRQIEDQHRSLELWMDSSVDLPGVQANLQFMDGGLQLWVRFPVIIRQAAAIDEKMTEALLQLVASNAEVKAAVSGQPVIKAAVKG